jgi:hypothetical protein
MSEVKLKPCPFCGAKVIKGTVFVHLPYQIEHFPKCIICKIDHHTTYLRSGEIRKWNRRVGEVKP